MVVGSATVEPVGVGVGLLSELFAVRLSYQAGSGPSSLVVKIAPSSTEARRVAAGYGFYAREVAVYRELGDEIGLRIPTIYLAEHDPATDDFVIVMEDLSGLRSANQVAGCRPADARQVVGDLARHHACFWEDSRLGDLAALSSFASPPFPAFHRQTTTAAWPATLARFGELLPPRFRALGDAWGEVGPRLMVEMGARPRTLTHGDARLDNMFFSDDARPVTLVDWQLASPWPGALDLACFIALSLSIDDRRRFGDELLAHYHQGLVDGGVLDYPMAELIEDLRRAVLFWFCSPITVSGLELATDRAVELARVIIERSMAAIDDLDALSLLD